jgi:tyrosyl-tRNA synthetase
MSDTVTMLKTLSSGAVQILPAGELEKKIKENRPLKIKLGMDPTSPDLHLGHAVVLTKMRQFQDAGHEIIIIIGDFTARIGDPTGKSKTRPALTDEEIARNTKTYFEQVGKILDTKKLRIAYNSEWLDTLTSKEMVSLCAKTTLARLTERDDFAKRIRENMPIGFHELLYPLFQGYDSVVLDADVELGGTDQTFNLLFGRFLQEQFGKKPQVILTMPLLEGLDGVEKMSKSLGNTIGLIIEPADAFGKLMSISDVLMWRYAELLLGTSAAELKSLKEQVVAGTLHPMLFKKDTAQAIITRFWSAESAIKAREQFEAVFQKQDYTKSTPVALPAEFPNPVWIVQLLKDVAGIVSTSEARRLIDAGAVAVNGEVVKDFKAEITWSVGMTLKVGKHKIFTLA